jgi:hypothetical protein
MGDVEAGASMTASEIVSGDFGFGLAALVFEGGGGAGGGAQRARRAF